MPFGGATRRKISSLALFAIALPATVLAIAPRAAAQNAPSAGANADEAQRNELYREAMKAASAGRWAEAKERLRAALAIRSSPKVLFSLAQAEEQLGQLASAQSDYAHSLENAAMEGKGDVVQAAESAQRALAPRVPHLRIVLSGVEPGRSAVTATLDERTVALGAPAAVDPGDHRVMVSAPGMRTSVVNVKLLEGQQLDVPISMEPEHVAPPAMIAISPPAPAAPIPSQPQVGRATAREAPVTTTSPLRTVGLLTAGAGMVALGVGVVFGLQSMSKHDEAAKTCPESKCPTASGAALWHDAVTAGNASTIAFVLGGVGLLGGAVLWLAAPSSNAAGAQIGIGPGSVHVRGAF